MKKKFILILLLAITYYSYSNTNDVKYCEPDFEVLEMVDKAHRIIKKSYNPDALPKDPKLLEETCWQLGKIFACLKVGRENGAVFKSMGCAQIIKSANLMEN